LSKKLEETSKKLSNERVEVEEAEQEAEQEEEEFLKCT